MTTATEQELVTQTTDELAFSSEFPELPQPDAVIDHTEANRILRRLGEHNAAITAIDEQLADQIDYAKRRADELKEPYQRRIDWLLGRFTALLEQFARQETQGAKERSVKLIGGRVGFRKGRASLEVGDEAAALAWAKESLPDAVKVAESLLKSPVTAHIEETGEVVPGVTYKPAEDKFYIE